ncbi:MAG: hypothetical protein JXA58_03715 [Dehalococcoidia bacterium]|nr:hypothetical protein [Dehalococcoidia bacterium]
MSGELLTFARSRPAGSFDPGPTLGEENFGAAGAFGETRRPLFVYTLLMGARVTADAKPPLVPMPAPIVLRFVALSAFLFVCGAVVAALCALLAGKALQGDTTGMGDLAAVLGGMLLGYPAGVCLGVVAVRWLFRWPGKVIWGIAGSVLGAALVMAAAEPFRLNANPDLLLVGYALFTALCATVGYLAFVKKS